jgi:hypothetical protein
MRVGAWAVQACPDVSGDVTEASRRSPVFSGVSVFFNERVLLCNADRFQGANRITTLE